MAHLGDTSAEAREIMTGIYRRMSPQEKLERVRQLTLAANRLALAGLGSRHPHETAGELLLRLARIRLGEPLANGPYEERGR